MRNKTSCKKHRKIMSGKLILLLISMTLLTMPYSSATGTWWTQYTSSLKDSFLETVPIYGAFHGSTSDSVMMQFYPVEEWEIEVCTRGLSTYTTKTSSGKTTSMNSWYEGIASTLSATKYEYEDLNETLYDIDWYIQSTSNNVTYSIYLRGNVNSGQRFYIPEYTNRRSQQWLSGTGVHAEYYKEKYTIAGIEYYVDDNDQAQYMETEIVDETTAEYE